MKLSDMSTDQLLDALVQLTHPVCTILMDSAVNDAIQSLLQAGLAKTTPGKAWSMLIAQLTPLLLQRHRDEAYAMAAVLLGRPVSQLHGENGLRLVAELCRCWEDELADFFPCAADMVSKPC